MDFKYISHWHTLSDLLHLGISERVLRSNHEFSSLCVFTKE